MFKINIDFSEVLSLDGLEADLNRLAQKAGQDMAKSIHAKLVELANKELGEGRRDKYIAAINSSQAGENEWLVSLDSSAEWIEDGHAAFNLIKSMLSSPKAKHGKEGPYMDVPFEQNKKAMSSMSPQQQALWGAIKSEVNNFKKLGSDLGNPGPVMGKDGNPKQGYIGSFNVSTKPNSTNAVPIGKGPKGSVAQGASGTPLLQGVRVYQQTVKTKSGKSKTQKMYVTFRRVSGKSKPPAWDHPGIEGVNLFDKAADWAQQELDQKLDKILNKIK